MFAFKPKEPEGDKQFPVATGGLFGGKPLPVAEKPEEKKPSFFGVAPGSGATSLFSAAPPKPQGSLFSAPSGSLFGANATASVF
jgi:hypothetical protein